NNARLVKLIPQPYKQNFRKDCSLLFDGYIMNQRIQSTECVNMAGKDIEIIFSLKKVQRINEVYIDLLTDNKRCVFPPSRITVSISLNGTKYRNQQVFTITDPFSVPEGRSHSLYRIKIPGKTLYVKINLTNPGPCSENSSKPKEDSRIIVDEIGVL
ncbi:MAG: hypothetical protein GXO47_05505, partial [Chlorobi bacterium]|nr:hypothetical protein [Chlorobiota bacterium]